MMINPIFTGATRESQGLVVFYQDVDDQPGAYVDPSYSAFGDLGSITISPDGEVFVVARPAIDVLENPAEQRNTIFRVDPVTGELSPWADLPLDHDPLDQPFGIMGLAVDCLNPFLYATSLTGSDEETEAGTIWRIDRRNGDATLLAEGYDMTTIAVGSSLSDRVLVLGAARSPALFVVPLSDYPLSEPDLLTSMAGVGPALSVRAIKLRPNPDQPIQIQATAVDFDYSLRALPDQAAQTLHFEWTAEDGYKQRRSRN